MALHTPTHHAGTAGHLLLRDLLIAIGLAVALLVVLALAMTVKVTIAPTNPVSTEQQSLIVFLDGERAFFNDTATTESRSLIEFRASERSGQ